MRIDWETEAADAHAAATADMASAESSAGTSPTSPAQMPALTGMTQLAAAYCCVWKLRTVQPGGKLASAKTVWPSHEGADAAHKTPQAAASEVCMQDSSVSSANPVKGLHAALPRGRPAVPSCRGPGVCNGNPRVQVWEGHSHPEGALARESRHSHRPPCAGQLCKQLSQLEQPG